MPGPRWWLCWAGKSSIVNAHIKSSLVSASAPPTQPYEVSQHLREGLIELGPTLLRGPAAHRAPPVPRCPSEASTHLSPSILAPGILAPSRNSGMEGPVGGWRWPRPHPGPVRIPQAASPHPSCFACLCQKVGIGDNLTIEIQEKEIRKSTSGVCLCSLNYSNS